MLSAANFSANNSSPLYQDNLFSIFKKLNFICLIGIKTKYTVRAKEMREMSQNVLSSKSEDVWVQKRFPFAILPLLPDQI